MAADRLIQFVIDRPRAHVGFRMRTAACASSRRPDRCDRRYERRGRGWRDREMSLRLICRSARASMLSAKGVRPPLLVRTQLRASNFLIHHALTARPCSSRRGFGTRCSAVRRASPSWPRSRPRASASSERRERTARDRRDEFAHELVGSPRWASRTAYPASFTPSPAKPSRTAMRAMPDFSAPWRSKLPRPAAVRPAPARGPERQLGPPLRPARPKGLPFSPTVAKRSCVRLSLDYARRVGGCSLNI